VRSFMLFLVLFCGCAFAQQDGMTNAERQDPGDEIGKFKKNCLFKHVLGCAEVLFTGQPLHIAMGSIAPQNGFGAGVAYVRHQDSENWSKLWSADAIGSNNASWRAGVYFKLVDTRVSKAGVQFGTSNVDSSDLPVYTEQRVFSFYAQSISLNKLTFFGEGPETTRAGRSFYGMTEHIVGASYTQPVYAPLNVGLYAEANARVVDIRGSHGQDSPSIEQLYTSPAAPGLNDQPFFMQLGAGLRMRPTAFNDLLHFSYDVAYRPYIDTSGSGYSFQRLTIDLYQEISLYHRHLLVPRETNDPNNCQIDPINAESPCPKVSRSLQGSLGLRVFTSLAMTPGDNQVPFYFQPTVGGADVNGNAALTSYQDFRFRAPNLLLLQENFEHSVGKLPIGFTLRADQAKLGLTRGGLGESHWRHSYAAGLTLRAGGFPQVYLLFAFGGGEGTHTIANMNTSLLGSSSRPSLY
jgi:hypothetical protein